MKKIYMAGPLFNEGEVAQRIHEAKVLRELIDEYDLDFEVFTPIEAPQNDKSKLPTHLDIFDGDEKEINESSIMFADLSHEDAGVMMELGMVLYREGYKVYPYLSDIRVGTAGEYDGIYVPFGYNQFVIGGLEKYFGKIYTSFDDAANAFIKDHI